MPSWITGAEAEAAFAAGYIDAEGSFGVYDGRARFKLDSGDVPVHDWMVVNEALGLRRLIATIDPFSRHPRRRATMALAAQNVIDRMRARAAA